MLPIFMRRKLIGATLENIGVPPVSSAIGDIKSVMGVPFAVEVSDKFVDATVMTYSATGLPSGIYIDRENGVISGAGVSGGTTTGVTVSATNESGATATSAPFSMVVNTPLSTAQFTVTDKPYMVADYDASVGVTKAGGAAALDGEFIDQIADQTGNGNHATTTGDVAFIAADARAGGLPSFGSATGSGVGGVISPLMSAGCAYFVTQYKAGTEDTFTGAEGTSNTLLTGNYSNKFEPNFWGALTTGSVLHSTDGVSGYPRINSSDDTETEIVLPMPLSVVRLPFDYGPIKCNYGVGCFIDRTNRRWPGPITRALFTTGTESAEEVLKIVAMLAHDAGIENKLSANNPYRNTYPTEGDRTLDLLPDTIQSETKTLIFSDTFDSQPDWATVGFGDINTGQEGANPSPAGWDYHYTSDLWIAGDEDSLPDSEPTLQINNRFARGDTGKSLLIFDESRGNAGAWGSDGILSKMITESSDVYAEMFVRFQPDYLWQGGNTSLKLIRFAHLDAGSTVGPFQAFSGGDLGPIMVLDAILDQATLFGSLRYRLATKTHIRCDPQGSNYYCGLYGEEKYGFIPGMRSFPTVTKNDWHKFSLRVKMNSAPGVGDGLIHVWFDNELVQSRTDVPFLGTEAPSGLKWNVLNIGGNSNNVPVDVSEKYEQWWAIDDVKVYSLDV